MSYLLIDDGNSRLKWAMASSAGELSQVQLATVNSKLETNWDDCEKPDAILISSVGSEQHKQNLIDLFENKWHIVPAFVTSPAKDFGVVNAYREPTRLGSDRWAAMIAAYQIEQSAVLVVDAGTALTIDAIDDNGRHLGGLISPGLSLSRRTLASDTNMEFGAVDKTSSSLFASSTEQGIAGGTHYALSSLVEHAYRNFEEQLGAATNKPRCYLTGGDAEKIKETLECPYTHEPLLVLKGLALIAVRE